MKKELEYTTEDAYVELREEFAEKTRVMEDKLWVDANIGEFDELIRLNYAKNLEEFSKVMIEHISEFSNAYTGIFYIYDQRMQVSRAIAGYAYEIQDLHHKEFKNGQSLVGQVAESKKAIFFDNLPSQSIHLNGSNTFKVSATSILVIPLVFNNLLYGVVELIYIQTIAKRQKQVLEAVSRNIAIMLESISNNAMTQKMLQESQEQAEALRAQEEELRQNMEELHSTQEEMFRQQSALNAQVKAIDNSIIAQIEFSREGIVQNANDVFCKLFKYEKEEIEGKPHRIFVTTEYANSPAYAKFWEDLREGKSLSAEFTRVNKNGELIWINGSYVPVMNKDGQVEKVLKLAVDITESKRLLKEMETLKRDMEARMNVFEKTTILSEADIFGNILYVNEKMVEVSQYSREELIGNPHNMLRHPDMPKAVFKYFWDTIKSGKVFRGIIKNRKKDGTHYWVDSCVAPILDENGKPVKYIGARYLIDDDHLAEKLFEKMLDELEITVA